MPIHIRPIKGKPGKLLDKILNTIEEQRPIDADNAMVDLSEGYWEQIDKRKLVYKEEVAPDNTCLEVSPDYLKPQLNDLVLVYRQDKSGTSQRCEYFSRMVEFLLRHHDQDIKMIRIELDDESTKYDPVRFSIEYEELARRASNLAGSASNE